VSTIVESARVRIVFGVGSVRDLAKEARALGVSRLLAIVDAPVDLPSDVPVAALITEVRGHVPVEHVDAALARTTDTDADGLLAIGGGSSVGLAKAVALSTGLPIIAVPTTYAGSEMTPIWGVTTDGHKTTGVNYTVVPRLVVYDPELQLTLPVGISAASGVNALAHAVEALWAPNANPVSTAAAVAAIGTLPDALRRIVAASRDIAGRTAALKGAWLAGTALATAGTALHHGLCHLLGGTFDLPHAELHAVLLPHVTRVAAPPGSGMHAQLAHAMGVTDPVAELSALTVALGLPQSLSALGLSQDQLSEATELACAKVFVAPVELNASILCTLLANAYQGPA
jgi:maleylacetate reductase